VLQLALQGCFVVAGFSGVSKKTGGRSEELKIARTLAHHFEIDVSNADGAKKKLVGEVEKLTGRPDLLVNTLKYKD